MRPGGFDHAPGFHGCYPPYLPVGSRPDVVVFHRAEQRSDPLIASPEGGCLHLASAEQC